HRDVHVPRSPTSIVGHAICITFFSKKFDWSFNLLDVEDRAMTSPLIAADVQTAPDLKAEMPPVAHPILTVKSHGRTDQGRVRPNNEDHFVIAELSKALQIRHSSLDQ